MKSFNAEYLALFEGEAPQVGKSNVVYLFDDHKFSIPLNI